MTSQIRATLIQFASNDEMVAHAARVSTNTDFSDKPFEGTIRYLGRESHTSPFEHNMATFMIEAPLFVRDQWVRHRTQSYSSLSLRYVALAPDQNIEDLFYIPSPERPLVNQGSGAHPKFEKTPDVEMYETMKRETLRANKIAYETYTRLLEEGIASEVARNVLPENTMTRFYATANLLNWSRFVKERTAENAQWEIKRLAEDVSVYLGDLFPIAWEALLSN